jgi:hypothetical protein
MPHFSAQLDGGVFGLDHDLKKYGEWGDDRFARKLDILYGIDRSSLMTKMSISMYKLASIRLGNPQ